MRSMDSHTIESELIKLLKLTAEEFAISKLKHETCSSYVNKELEEIKQTIALKLDKAEGDKLLSSIQKIQKVLNMDNSDEIERTIKIANKLVGVVLSIIGGVTIASAAIYAVIKMIMHV